MINGAYIYLGRDRDGNAMVTNTVPNVIWNKSEGTGFRVDASIPIGPGTELKASYGNTTRNKMFGIDEASESPDIVVQQQAQKRVRPDEKKQAISHELQRLNDNTTFAELKSKRKARR
jgi:hypothetical protein